MAASISNGLCVAHITEAPLGGVLSCIQEIMAAQVRSPAIARVCALVPEINAGPLCRSVPEGEIHSFPHRRGSVVALVRLAIAAKRLVRDVQPDIVHIHSTIAGVVIRICLLFVRRKPKVLYCPHGWIFSQARRKFVKRLAAQLERLLSFATDSILCVSEFDKQEATAVGIAAEKCVVITNGLAELPEGQPKCSKHEGARPRRLKILFIGRFDIQKGFDIYLDAMRRLSDIADGIAVGGFIVSQPRPLSVPVNVTIAGWRTREELHDFYLDADLLVMPSRTESFPLVAIEAMRAGVPVFASRVGGLPEIVKDRVTGRLFESDDVDGLISLVRTTPHEALVTYGRQGRARYEIHLTASRMNADLIAHYRQLTGDVTAPHDLCPAE